MRRLALAAAAALAACSTIQHYETPRQALGKPLSAGVGDIVLSIEKTRDLENVAGRADVWGRKTHEGSTQLRYLGAEADGTLVFSRRDIEVITNESTVSRMGFVPIPTSSTTTSTSNISGNYGRTPFSANGYGSSTTVGMAYVPTAPAHTMAVPSGEIAIRVAPGQQIVRVSGHTVRIRHADGSGIEYEIQGGKD